MARRRKNDDPNGRLYFRSERIVQEQGKWHFLTRERTLEGPFETRMDAVRRLETYIRLAEMDLLQQQQFGSQAKVNVR